MRRSYVFNVARLLLRSSVHRNQQRDEATDPSLPLTEIDYIQKLDIMTARPGATAIDENVDGRIDAMAVQRFDIGNMEIGRGRRELEAIQLRLMKLRNGHRYMNARLIPKMWELRSKENSSSV